MKTLHVKTANKKKELEALTSVDGVRGRELEGDLGALEARLAPVGDSLQLYCVVAVGLQWLQGHRILRLQVEGTHTDSVTSRPASELPCTAAVSLWSTPARLWCLPGLSKITNRSTSLAYENPLLPRIKINVIQKAQTRFFGNCIPNPIIGCFSVAGKWIILTPHSLLDTT